jgi:hypothetical protein
MADPLTDEAASPAGPDPDAAGGGAPGGPPQGGGPILAALSRRQTGPQVSAPGPGDQASSMTMVMNALALMQQALPGLQPGSPIHRDALRALNSLSKHVGGGATTTGVQQTQLQDLLRNTVRNALLQKIMGQQAQGQQQGGGPVPGAPAGAMPQAPMPSTPLPGT